jgi:sugar/nucleoside kinase (ribokinase family)
LKKVLCAGEINVDLVLQGYTEFPVPGKEVLVEDSQLVLGSATAILAMGLARLGSPSWGAWATTSGATTASTTWRAAGSTSPG